MASIARFSQNMRKKGSKIQNETVRLIKEVSTTTLTNLVRETPVDKGVARSNWRVSRVNRTFAQIEAYAPGRYLGKSETANAAAAINAGKSVISQLRSGEALYITNNTAYIAQLEAGYSSQSSPGWIEAEITLVRIKIRNFKYRLG